MILECCQYSEEEEIVLDDACSHMRHNNRMAGTACEKLRGTLETLSKGPHENQCMKESKSIFIRNEVFVCALTFFLQRVRHHYSGHRSSDIVANRIVTNF